MGELKDFDVPSFSMPTLRVVLVAGISMKHALRALCVNGCGIFLIERNSNVSEPRLKEGHRSKSREEGNIRAPKRESFSTSQVVGSLPGFQPAIGDHYSGDDSVKSWYILGEISIAGEEPVCSVRAIMT